MSLSGRRRPDVAVFHVVASLAFLFLRVVPNNAFMAGLNRWGPVPLGGVCLVFCLPFHSDSFFSFFPPFLSLSAQAVGPR